MRATTHLAFAALIEITAAGFGATPGVPGSSALAVGALLPDIDTQHSGVGKWIKPISSRLERSFGHRTITHSVLGLLILAVLSSPLLLLSQHMFGWLLIGYSSHVLLDTANVIGVPLLYPARLQFWLVRRRDWRVPYGSQREFAWLGCIALTAVALVPLSSDGFTPWFHRALGTPYGAVEDYLRWRNDYEVWVTIKGTNLTTDEDIDGRYRAIDALGKEALLVEDEAGRAYLVGLGERADILTKRIQTWRGEPIVSSTYRVELAGRLVSDLINALPKGARRVHVTAALSLKEAEDTPPTVGYFERVKRFGDEFEIRSATAGDLAPLARQVIEGGSAVVRAEYSPGSEALANLSVSASTPAYKSHVLSIPDLPSLAGLVVEVGDEVSEGDLIARYIDDGVLESSQADAEEAKAERAELETQLENEQILHENELAGLKEVVEAEKVGLERVAYLVERGAEPRAAVIEAESSLQNAEQAVLKEETRWTSRQNALGAQIRKAGSSIVKSKREQQAQMEKQWVRTPVAGVVSDIRLVGVTVRGVDVEVTVFEEKAVADNSLFK